MKRNFFAPDPTLLVLALVLTCVGLFFVFDAGYARSLGDGKGLMPPEFRSQLIFLVPSLVVGGICCTIRPETWKKRAPLCFLLLLVVLALVCKIGLEKNGARRWLGFGSFAVQPAELAKIAVILYLAKVLVDRKPWPSRNQT